MRPLTDHFSDDDNTSETTRVQQPQQFTDDQRNAINRRHNVPRTYDIRIATNQNQYDYDDDDANDHNSDHDNNDTVSQTSSGESRITPYMIAHWLDSGMDWFSYIEEYQSSSTVNRIRGLGPPRIQQDKPNLPYILAHHNTTRSADGRPLQWRLDDFRQSGLTWSAYVDDIIEDGIRTYYRSVPPLRTNTRQQTPSAAHALDQTHNRATPTDSDNQDAKLPTSDDENDHYSEQENNDTDTADAESTTPHYWPTENNIAAMPTDSMVHDWIRSGLNWYEYVKTLPQPARTELFTRAPPATYQTHPNLHYLANNAPKQQEYDILTTRHRMCQYEASHLSWSSFVGRISEDRARHYYQSIPPISPIDRNQDPTRRRHGQNSP